MFHISWQSFTVVSVRRLYTNYIIFLDPGWQWHTALLPDKRTGQLMSEPTLQYQWVPPSQQARHILQSENRKVDLLIYKQTKYALQPRLKISSTFHLLSTSHSRPTRQSPWWCLQIMRMRNRCHLILAGSHQQRARGPYSDTLLRCPRVHPRVTS